MNVYHFNTTKGGGAGIAALRVFESVTRFDQKVNGLFFSREKAKPEKLFQTFDPYNEQGVLSKLFKLPSRRRYYKALEDQTAENRGRYEKFSLPWQPCKTPFQHFPLPDIIHLHWISDWLDYPSFFESLPPHIPIVWTLHDMNPFTGGCHYTWGCEKFQHHCNNCPQLAYPASNDLSFQGFELKQKVLANRKLYIAANSSWTAEQAAKSRLFSHAKQVQPLHYPVDTDIFKPLDKATCKKQLGLSGSDRVIAFGAERPDNYRKGFDLLLEAIHKIQQTQPDVKLLVFGNMDQQKAKQAGLAKVQTLGFVADPDKQALIYNAADVFVIASRQEAFGQTALEAIACGTPVAGFNVGGIADTVITGKNGLLASTVNAEALAGKIEELLNNDALREAMGKNGREHAVYNFSMEGQGRKMYQLYQEALK